MVVVYADMIPALLATVYTSTRMRLSGSKLISRFSTCQSWFKLTVLYLLRQDARIQDLHFNISEMKLSNTSLYIISDSFKYDIIWTENSNVIDSLISEILKYELSVIETLTEKT